MFWFTFFSTFVAVVCTVYQGSGRGVSIYYDLTLGSLLVSKKEKNKLMMSATSTFQSFNLIKKYLTPVGFPDEAAAFSITACFRRALAFVSRGLALLDFCPWFFALEENRTPVASPFLARTSFKLRTGSRIIPKIQYGAHQISDYGSIAKSLLSC